MYKRCRTCLCEQDLRSWYSRAFGINKCLDVNENIFPANVLNLETVETLRDATHRSKRRFRERKGEIRISRDSSHVVKPQMFSCNAKKPLLRTQRLRLSQFPGHREQ